MRPILLPVLLSAGLLAFAAPALAASALTVAEAGFSAGPGNDYDVSRKLAVGTHVDVVWCGAHGNWCLVDIHNKRGWVPFASLTFKIPHAVSMDGGTSGDGGTSVAVATGGTKSVASAPEAQASQGSGITFTQQTFNNIKLK